MDLIYGDNVIAAFKNKLKFTVDVGSESRIFGTLGDIQIHAADDRPIGGPHNSIDSNSRNNLLRM